MKRHLFLLLVLSCASSAQNGAALYQKHCAMCHDSAQGHAPTVQSLRAMSDTALLRALETGMMREQAKDLSAQERQALVTYLNLGSHKAEAGAAIPASAYCSSPFAWDGRAPSWNGFGAGLTNTRFQTTDAAGLTLADIPKLRLRWAFGLGDVTMARGQPVVVGNRVFAATAEGKLYALDAKTGCLYWVFQAGAAIRSGVVAGAISPDRLAVFFGDAQANAYAVDVSGKLLWKVHPEEHPAAVMTGAPAFADGVVYFGISSIEEVIGSNPKYECCTFRGSLVALHAATGATAWKAYTISDPPAPTKKNTIGVQLRGPSGAGVWSTPTIDVRRNAIYVATGDNYSDPPTQTSDAVLAFDRTTGKPLWSRQMTANDAYNLGCSAGDKANCPEAKGPDLDFGQPPILVSLTNGKQALVIGQKSGVAWAIDPDRNGNLLWQTRVGKGSALGGSQWGSAADERYMYVSISDIAFRAVKDVPGVDGDKYELDSTKGGGVFALDLLTGNKVWSATPPACGDRRNCSPAQPGAVSAIPGAVFAGSLDGHLRAYANGTGEILWDVDTAREYNTVNGQKAHGGALDGGGPAIAGGLVYVYSGYSMWGEIPGNVLLAFSVDGK